MNFSVFENEKYPSEKQIALGSSIEAHDVNIFFQSRVRDEITLNVLRAEYAHDPAACLSFMTAEAFAFFLPAYMKIALNDFDDADAIPESIIFDLYRMAMGGDKDRLNAIKSSYTGEQLGTVAEFLMEMSHRYWHSYPKDDAKAAFLAYWGKASNKTWSE